MKDFFERYDHLIIPEPNTGCWLWTAGAATFGYGVLSVNGKTVNTHRLAYEAIHGEGSAKGWEIRHRCDNPPCVNPDHLLRGTHKDNMDDIMRRKRHNPPYGERSNSNVLTAEIVMALRERAEHVHISQVVREFGVPFAAGRFAIIGTTWKHLPLAKKIIRKSGRRPRK